MSSTRTFVVVGGGLAGAKTAESLRDKDFDGSIILLSEEEHLPYERPPLSKEHFAGKKLSATSPSTTVTGIATITWTCGSAPPPPPSTSPPTQ